MSIELLVPTILASPNGQTVLSRKIKRELLDDLTKILRDEIRDILLNRINVYSVRTYFEDVLELGRNDTMTAILKIIQMSEVKFTLPSNRDWLTVYEFVTILCRLVDASKLKLVQAVNESLLNQVPRENVNPLTDIPFVYKTMPIDASLELVKQSDDIGMCIVARQVYIGKMFYGLLHRENRLEKLKRYAFIRTEYATLDDVLDDMGRIIEKMDIQADRLVQPHFPPKNAIENITRMVYNRTILDQMNHLLQDCIQSLGTIITRIGDELSSVPKPNIPTPKLVILDDVCKIIRDITKDFRLIKEHCAYDKMANVINIWDKHTSQFYRMNNFKDFYRTELTNRYLFRYLDSRIYNIAYSIIQKSE